MFTVYYSNQIASHKDLLIKILQNDPNPDPFSSEIVLVQSLGMAQWLQMQIAEETGVMGNIQFPYPTSFFWQQYRLLFPELPKENIFERNAMVWRLMRLIPAYLTTAEFSPLASYLHQSDQLKQFQLASKIADLFDQYLVYRPQWLVHWEKGNLEAVLNEIRQTLSFKSKDFVDIEMNMQWQSILWNALVADIQQDTPEIIFNTSHRAYLQQRYFDKLDNLTEIEKAQLPKRIFVFGISSLPQTQLAVLKKLSEYCTVHFFFTNPSQEYWANDQEERILEKLALKKQLSNDELNGLFLNQGNPLLTTWGKQGKEFLSLLTENELQDVSYYLPFEGESLLAQVKNTILLSEYQPQFKLSKEDNSLQIHSCHSKMREIEVLHNQLLLLFEKNPDLTPKDIIVMSSDIDSYAPYINAVFSIAKRKDSRFIPFALSDQKISYLEPIVASFLNLLMIKERKFTLEELFSLFDVEAIREKYQLTALQLTLLRDWLESAGIRAGLQKDNVDWTNYNSWENGLNRLLLGISLTSQNNPWQGILAFDESYGLASEIIGAIAKFIQNITAWVNFIATPHHILEWKNALNQLIERCYQESELHSVALLTLSQGVESIISYIEQAKFDALVDIDVIATLFEQQLSQQRNNLNFLVGKVNFCTLLPMRAIPFKVVCLLGMNEGDFPRQQSVNNFDLMQYAYQKGDRAKRDDDRYLFLEALLSAQQIFYISYIGQSLTRSADKLPSILVSQLKDYIQHGLGEENSLPIYQHSMTVFSPANFTEGNIAYNKEWLKAKNQEDQVDEFLTPLDSSEIANMTEIELDDLIAYLQSPLKFFFNRQLGIRFENEGCTLEESEHFNLSNLEKFNLRDELLTVDINNVPLFLENAKLKGELPACYFAEISETELVESIEDLREKLAGYLSTQADIIPIEHLFFLSDNPLKLIGNIPNKFEKDIIQWRVGALRDKDLIKSWVYYLVLITTGFAVERFRFYYRVGNQAKYLTFLPLSSEDASKLLQRYLEDYVASFTQLRWAITDNLEENVIKVKEGKISVEILCQKRLQSESPDAYLQRVMAHTISPNYEEIHQLTVAWFDAMVQHIDKDLV